MTLNGQNDEIDFSGDVRRNIPSGRDGLQRGRGGNRAGSRGEAGQDKIPAAQIPVEEQAEGGSCSPPRTCGHNGAGNPEQ